MKLGRFVLNHRAITRRREIKRKDPQTNIKKRFGAVEQIGGGEMARKHV